MSRLLGQSIERRAERQLAGRGLETLQRNYGTRFGELDLVMRDHDELVFVEVRFRTTIGAAVDSVDIHKQRRLRAAAAQYLAEAAFDEEPACRFDVFALAGPDTSRVEQTQWLRDAFS